MLNGRDFNSNKMTMKMTKVTKLLSNKQSWVKSVMLTRCLTQTMVNSGQTNILLKKISQWKCWKSKNANCMPIFAKPQWDTNKDIKPSTILNSLKWVNGPHLEEALGSSAARLVVLAVGHGFPLLPLFPAQSVVVAEALDSRGEHLVHSHGGFSLRAGLTHSELHLSVPACGPELCALHG